MNSIANTKTKFLPLNNILSMLDWVGVDLVEFKESEGCGKKYMCVIHAQGKPFCILIKAKTEDDVRMMGAEACLNLVRQLEKERDRKKALEIRFVLNREGVSREQ